MTREDCLRRLRAAQALVAGAPIGERRRWLKAEKHWLRRLSECDPPKNLKDNKR